MKLLMSKGEARRAEQLVRRHLPTRQQGASKDRHEPFALLLGHSHATDCYRHAETRVDARSLRRRHGGLDVVSDQRCKMRELLLVNDRRWKTPTIR